MWQCYLLQYTAVLKCVISVLLRVRVYVYGRMAEQVAAGSQSEEKVKEFMRKKERELQHSCEVKKKAEGILHSYLPP